MSDGIDLNADLEKVAHKLLEAAAQDGVALKDRLEVFKTLSQHYVSLEKVKGKTAPPDGKGTTMQALREHISQSGEQPEEDDE